MKWYIPSFHGDFRFETDPDHLDGSMTRLTVEKPTPGEIEALTRWGEVALAQHWLRKEELPDLLKLARDEIKHLTIVAPLMDVAAPMARLLKAKNVGVLTALKFQSGHVEVTEIVKSDDLPRWMRKAEEKAKAPAEAAVTVARPKLSCPECSGLPEGRRKACDVLWAFLDPTQRQEWLAERRFTAYGSETEHAYDVAPRDHPRSAARGRIAYDLDDRVILHNFDLELPPEEEALQVKLMLEHREQWIRVSGEVDPSRRASPGTIFPNVLPTVYH